MTTVRRLRVNSALTAGLALTVTLVAGRSVTAHRLDECLQAARIDLRADGVLIDVDLTPGAAVAESILAAIDRNRDGSTSDDEEHAYARAVVSALQVELDGEPLPLRLQSSSFPLLAALRRGEGSIRIRAFASHDTLPTGTHQLFFRNRHLAPQSVYLSNALVPESAAVSVLEQRRDAHQRELTIDYAVRSETGTLAGWLLVTLAFAAVAASRLPHWLRAS